MQIDPRHMKTVGKGLLIVVQVGKRLDELLKTKLDEAERAELFGLIRRRPGSLSKREKERRAELLKKAFGDIDGLGGLVAV